MPSVLDYMNMTKCACSEVLNADSEELRSSS